MTCAKANIFYKKNVYLTILLHISTKRKLTILYYLKIQPLRFQHKSIPNLFHVTCDKFVERTDWLSHKELLDTLEIFRGSQ